jgi:CRISPR-associated protein Csb2
LRGRHVLEWPPSPFALLGAIVGGWSRSATTDIACLQRLCDLLADVPFYDLPPSSIDHVVHYPPGSTCVAQQEISPALDAFSRNSRDSQNSASAYVIWPAASLEASDAPFLDSILSRIHALDGQPCEFAMVDHAPGQLDRIEVRPAFEVVGHGPIVRRLVVRPEIRGTALLKALLRDAMSTPVGHRNVPNDTVLIDYKFPPQFGLNARDVVARDRSRGDLPPRIERFALRPASGSRAPLITDTIVISEAMRWATMRASSARELRVADPVFTGKAPSGRPAVGHGHAFFLPRDLDDDARIDHLDVWYPTGSSIDTQRASIATRLLYDHRLDGRFHLEHIGAVEAPSGIRWRSSTPFVLERHVKTAGRGRTVIKSGAPHEQVRASLANHGVSAVPSTIRIDADAPAADSVNRRSLSPAMFRRARLKETHAMPGFFVELSFDSVVEGPIVAGKHAHFGLGQFTPIT